MKPMFVVFMLAFAIALRFCPAAETLGKSDAAQVQKFERALTDMMGRLKKLAERTRKDKLLPREPQPFGDDEAFEILGEIAKVSEESPVNMARALENFMTSNPDFTAGRCTQTFRLAYVLLLFRDYPGELGGRFNKYLVDSRVSDDHAFYLLQATEGYRDDFNIDMHISERLVLERLAKCMRNNDRQFDVEFNFPEKGRVVWRLRDFAYMFLCERYESEDLNPYIDYDSIPKREAFIAKGQKFIADKLARMDLTDAMERYLREQARLQLSPEEYDSVFKTWRTLGGGTAPDAELMLTLDNLFAQAALNAKRAPSDRDKAMTMHLAQRARELLQKDKVEIAPLGEDDIRYPESVWTWFRNPLAVRVYKQKGDPLNGDRDLALRKFLLVYEARHDRGELFPLPKEEPAPPEKPAAPAAAK